MSIRLEALLHQPEFIIPIGIIGFLMFETILLSLNTAGAILNSAGLKKK